MLRLYVGYSEEGHETIEKLNERIELMMQTLADRQRLHPGTWQVRLNTRAQETQGRARCHGIPTTAY